MSKDKREYDFEEFENGCHKTISAVFALCEVERTNHNANSKALCLAALAVRETLLTFLALVAKMR